MFPGLAKPSLVQPYSYHLCPAQVLLVCFDLRNEIVERVEVCDGETCKRSTKNQL